MSDFQSIIGIDWRDPAHWWLKSEIREQRTIFDYFTDDGIFIETSMGGD